MIVVLGRPEVTRSGDDGQLVPGGLAANVAMAIGRERGPVELVGSIGDDAEGDHVVVELGRAGVGHAALLRDPAARTPVVGQASSERPRPRFSAADIELGLRYVPDCRVLVIAESMTVEAQAAALDGAAYHGAAVVMIAAAGRIDAASLDDRVTLLERPAAEDDDEDGASDIDDDAFVAFVAEYAARLDRGETPADAFRATLGDSAWESSGE